MTNSARENLLHVGDKPVLKRYVVRKSCILYVRNHVYLEGKNKQNVKLDRTKDKFML